MAEVLRPETVVAGYRIDGFLGEGGMGTVYEATQLSLDRKVALKIVSPGLSSDGAFRARFQKEGLVQARMEHPNIVTVYEAGEEGGLLFLAMRLIRGSSLKDMLRNGALKTPRTLHILHAVADALDSAHDAGLIHRDVKPQNILIGARDHSYLADFGITKGVNETGFTRTGQFMWSLDYVAPEEFEGEALTTAADVYALGAVLFECLTGVVPFAKETVRAVLYAHVVEEPPKISARRPDLPTGLDEVIAEGMAKDPSARPTASALIEAAERCFAHSPNVIAISAPTQEPAPPPFHVAPIAVEEIATPGRAPADAAGDAAAGWLAGAPAVGAARTRQARPSTPGSLDISDQSSFGRLGETGRAGRSYLLRARVLTVALLVGAAVIVGSGYAIGQGSPPSGTSARTRRPLTAGIATITLKGAWQETGSPHLPGLSFGVQAAARSTSDGLIMLGVLSTAEGRYLLPTTFKKSLAHEPLPDGVRLGAAYAYRFRDLELKGSRTRVNLMVVPTSAGAVAILCVAPNATRVLAMSCEAAGSSLRLSGAEPLALGPNPQYARVLSSAVTKVRSATSYERSLVHAQTRAGQARLSSTLSGIYESAAVLLAKAEPGPDSSLSNANLLSALRLTAHEYGAMSKAARTGKAAGFHEAGTRRLESQHSLELRLAALRADGYT